jgi:hypothetical protein
MRRAWMLVSRGGSTGIPFGYHYIENIDTDIVIQCFYQKLEVLGVEEATFQSNWDRDENGYQKGLAVLRGKEETREEPIDNSQDA